MARRSQWDRKLASAESGFTLIEMLVAITILVIMMAIAALTIPNHDDRYWRDNLDQLVSSLNLAQEESALSGTTMFIQIDALGWRFSQTPNSSASSQLMGFGGTFSNPVNVPTPRGSSGLMPDVYAPQLWYKPVVIEPVQLSLGGETIAQAIRIPIAQEQRRALLIRNTNGRFAWAAATP